MIYRTSRLARQRNARSAIISAQLRRRFSGTSGSARPLDVCVYHLYRMHIVHSNMLFNTMTNGHIPITYSNVRNQSNSKAEERQFVKERLALAYRVLAHEHICE